MTKENTFYPRNKMEVGGFLISCILIIIFVIFGSLSIIYHFRVRDCYLHRNPWCFNDWVCLKGGSQVDVVAKWKEGLDNCRITPSNRDPTKATTLPGGGTKKPTCPGVGDITHIAPSASLPNT